MIYTFNLHNGQVFHFSMGAINAIGDITGVKTEEHFVEGKDTGPHMKGGFMMIINGVGTFTVSFDGSLEDGEKFEAEYFHLLKEWKNYWGMEE